MAETTTTNVAPATFIEGESKLYLDELKKAIGNLKGADLSTILGPQFIAGLDPLQKQAMELAGGLGSYKPYLEAAQGFTGPEAYKQFMSPYQQDVINTTLQEYDIQAQKGAQGVPAAAIAAGAFGGGREGVQRAEYQSASDRNRAGLQAQLLQQGFGQAQDLAARQYQQQMGLAQTAPALVGQQISALTGLGAQQQARQQATLEAQRQLAYQQAYQPYQATQALGSGVMGLISGYPQQTQQTITPSPSPLSTALGTGSTLTGIYSLVRPK